MAMELNEQAITENSYTVDRLFFVVLILQIISVVNLACVKAAVTCLSFICNLMDSLCTSSFIIQKILTFDSFFPTIKKTTCNGGENKSISR